MSYLVEMQDDPVTKAALAKLAPVAENFLNYLFSWEGDVVNDRKNCVMKVTGCVFRESKSGPRKGHLCMQVKGTERSAFLTADEVRSCLDSNA